MIYLKLKGRIGNQLFQYAAARQLQKQIGGDCPIIIDDSDNHAEGYVNSLVNYDLCNVHYVDDDALLKSNPKLKRAQLLLRAIAKLEAGKDKRGRFDVEKKWLKLANKFGLYYLYDGYAPFANRPPQTLLLNGYFQSEKYFDEVKDEVKEVFSLKEEVAKSNYPNLVKIQNRNTVCISIKVQHNVGNEMFDVCNDGYWQKAIDYITENVENPLFFVCSDNVQYVKENLIDCTKYDVVEQSSDFPVHISLAVMAQSKHFIIGNTSFGWWAQYLSENPDKIVIAPSRWYGTDVPCDVYQDNWTLIEV